MSISTPLPLPKYRPNSNTNVKPIFQIKTLQRQQILDLRENCEGDLCFPDVSEHDLHNWKLQNPDLLEAKDIRFEYNFLTERFIIKCMPTATHDSLQAFFMQNVFGALAEKVGFSQAMGLVNINSGTTFGGFKGDWTGSSEKQPDAYVKLTGSKFPAVVCEAGWSETLEHLMADARLWLLHTGGITRIVIVVCITETNTWNTADVHEKISDDVPTMGKTLTEEQALMQGISAGTDLNYLAERLTNLNTHAKLTKPLVSDLKACENQADIWERFGATVIPAPPVESEAPTEFKIPFMDIFGDKIPVGVDPTDSIIFSLAGFREFVTRSLQDTEWLRATRRARKLLKAAGEWEETDTFAQHKRRRHSGGSGLK
ncbi:hypothetical protein L873DRAFT_1794341 [Choiromyces venosus 120613-1]|uniref:Uncharacterized protein n=1 Tax=Choiromyces venosus 120613-1 TaxID=1336337 RepID=A0A3N4J1L2_9PEZI|nr:hypothetical protein L873DRAFT_1794341 [Choiromyces venosus 120613-1]